MLKLLSLVIVCTIFPSVAQAKGCDSLESLAWLVGNWYSESSKLKIKESWIEVSSKSFEGAGETYSIPKKGVVSAETLRLVEMSGEIFYIAKVASNDLPVSFKLTHCTNKTAMFENPQHDFPKRINYELTSENDLSVFVSGENGKGFSINFTKN